MGMRITVPLLLWLVVLTFGCSHQDVPTSNWNDVWRSTSSRDSLGFEEFFALSDERQDERRREARAQHQLARTEPEHRLRVGRLVTAVGLAPDDAELWLSLALECERVGDWDAALRCVTSAQRACPYVIPEQRHAMRVRTAVARAWLHRDRGEWALAHAWSDSASLWSPNERGVRLLRGICLASHGDFVGAINMAKDTETKRFDWFEWRWIRGMAEYHQDNVESAYHWLRDARPVQPWSRRFWHDLATVCERLGNDTEAARFHRRSFDSNRLPAGSAQEFRMRVRWPGAERYLDLPAWRGYDRLPTGGSILGWSRTAADSFFTAGATGGKGHWADIASTLLSHCVRSDIDVSGSLAMRGRIYAEMGADDLALADLQRLMRGRDIGSITDHLALAWYGRLLIVSSRYRIALPYLERAVALDPGLARAWGDLGLALVMTRRAASGEEAFSRALVLDPGLAAVWYNRGLARYHAKRWAEAVSDLEQALSLAPDNAEVQVLLQQAAQRLQVQQNRGRRQ